MNNDKIIAAIAPAFTALMIEKIQNLKTGWNKPWVSMAQGCPRNLAGRYYNGGNLFMLLLLTEYKRYKTPIFLTYKQAQDEEINVKKGEKSFPVYFWYLYAIPKAQKDGKGMPYEKYARLSDEQKKAYKLLPLLRYYSVFNIDQTDMPEKNPERYARLLEQAAGMPQTDGTTCAEVDHMVDVDKMRCRIPILRCREMVLQDRSIGIRQRILSSQRRCNRMPAENTIPQRCGLLFDAAARGRPQHGPPVAAQPGYVRVFRFAQLCPRGTDRRNDRRTLRHTVRACDNAAAGKRRLPRKLAAGAERETRIPVRNPYRREQGRDDDCRPGRAMQRQTRRNSRVNRIITGRGSLRPQYPKL